MYPTTATPDFTRLPAGFIQKQAMSVNPVWIVDDDRSIRWVFEKALAREGIAYRAFSTAQEALDALATETPRVVVSDIRMPGESGLVLLQKVREKFATLPVIIMTAYSDLGNAVTAFQGGAYEYLPKPFDVDTAVELIRRAMSENQTPQAAVEVHDSTPEILGQAPSMQNVFRAIGRLAQSNATVLITGESGTGKELASALHQHSPRAKLPFIAINTAAIPKDLLESELFGHERGAFTGAQTTRRGRFEQAEGGTLFLDEIGDMPAELQTRLLRVLSDNHYYRVGGQQPIKANVRVIAATHQDLEVRVKQGLFREDLFHRLNVIRLRLPSLRERREDIPLLAQHFLRKSAKDLNVDVKRLSNSVVKYLITMDFPGNVRQLENLCHWLTVMAPSAQIEIEDLPPEIRSEAAVPVDQDWIGALEREAGARLARGETRIMDELTHQFEKALILKALAQTGGRRIEAATLLGIGRNTLTRKVQELGIDNKDKGSD